MLTQIHAVALAKFVFEAMGIEPVANNWQTKFAFASISVFWGRNRLVSHNSMTAPSRFEDRRIVVSRLACELSGRPGLCAGRSRFQVAQ
jgi:hypothetical protein